ncbi:hypothetical protein GOC23_31045 [Sinorhizobium meliloti]|nr:hypothetical protein [Sinorhizobium meliloti]
MSDKSKEQSLEQLAEAVAAVNRTSKLLRLSISELTQVRQTEAVSSDDLAKNWSHGEVLELVAGSIESLKVSDTKPALIGARLTPITFDDTFRWIPPEEETDAGWTKTAMDALKQAVDAATVWVQTNSGPTSTTPPADTAPDDTAPPEQDGGVMVNPEFIGDAAAEASPATKSDTFGFDKIYQKDQSPGSEDGIGNVLFDPNQKSTNVDNNVIQRQSI